MPFVKCPHCNEWVELDVVHETPPIEVIVRANQLTPVAAAILQNRENLPPAFLRGEPVSLRVLGDTIGYTHGQVRKGLIELTQCKLIKTVDFGRAGRKTVRGVIETGAGAIGGMREDLSYRCIHALRK